MHRFLRSPFREGVERKIKTKESDKEASYVREISPHRPSHNPRHFVDCVGDLDYLQSCIWMEICSFIFSLSSRFFG